MARIRRPEVTLIDDPDIQEKEEVELEDETDESLPITYSITSYGADYPVDGLVKRIEKGDIYVPPFQRGYTWVLSKASRFIESLLLGLPVPGIFLAAEANTRKLLVIDGQQRLRTLQYFYKGVIAERSQAFSLSGLKSSFDGSTYERLSPEDRRRLDDSIMHATIVRQDQPSDDDSSIYEIFSRLNTGADLLQPQEIRACMYHGPFNDLLHRLNKNQDWRAIFGPESRRMRDQELVLRVFALMNWRDRYKRPMKEFLNKFMKKHRNIDEETERAFIDSFQSSIKAIRLGAGDRAFRPARALNAAVYDAVMIGIMTRLAQLPIKDFDLLGKQYRNLLEGQDFTQLTQSRTTDETIVAERIKLAIEVFSKLT